MASTDPRIQIDAREARTPLERRLEEIRAAIVSSGTDLLSGDDLEREISTRRGERRISDGG
jgi:hypothetical protein